MQMQVRQGDGLNVQFFINNVKMSNFSQSISASFKCDKQKSSVSLPLSFKIPQPKCNKTSRQMTTQQSINVCSDTANSIFHKNMSKSYSKQRLEDQYISFKLKPAKQQDKPNPVRISKEKSPMQPNRQVNNYKPIAQLNRQTTNFYFAPFEQSREYQKKNSMSELSKSPEFFCKPNSEDSIKESFEEQKQKQPKVQNNKKPYYDENSFCKMISQSQENQGHKKYENPLKQIQKQTSKKQLKIDFDLNDSVIEDDFQNFQLITPYKELKEEFQRQQKLYEKQIKISRLQQFDSFSKRNPQSAKDYSQANFKNHKAYLEACEKKLIYEKVQDLRVNQRKPIPQNTEKKSFFFLTNPTIQSGKKQPNLQKPYNQFQGYQQKKQSEQKNVQEFCFSLSSIKLSTQSSIQQPCTPQNLFSNSKDQIFIYESKNCSKNFGSFGGSKKVHIRQLVQEFVDQLENLDEKSLNEKNLHELEDVLESIVFKESKTRREPIYIQEEAPSVRPRSRSPVIEEQTKKWQKIKRDNSSDIATERKAVSEFQNFEHKFSPHKRQNHYAFTMSSSQKKPVDSHCMKSPLTKDASLSEKENIKKQSVYKPNFGMCGSREKKLNQEREKENQRACTAFTNLKQKQQSAMNINQKSSVYVKKGAKSSREHLKTEASHNPSRWRVY